MKKLSVIYIIAVFLQMYPQAQASIHSEYSRPKIVFIHGWLGWGEHKMLGLRSWGGAFLSIRGLFKSAGYDTIELGVGPLSSNWDRTAEAYAQLKGGCVDYGLAHSREHDHDRFGVCYKAKFKDWGDSQDKNIHLVGHSLGGLTSRLLVDLLFDGDEKELATNYAGHKPISPLYLGGKKYWVKSVNTVASGHNGTPLTNFIYEKFPNVILRFAQAVSALHFFEPLTTAIYDFQVGHWGLIQKKGESYGDFLKRFKKHRINNGKDVSLFDLRPEGAMYLNSFADAKENVFYTSWPIYTTRTDYDKVESVGTIWTSPILKYFSEIIGKKTQDWVIYYNSDIKWLKNDGLVPTESQKCPIFRSMDKCYSYDGYLVKGSWAVMPEFASDHLEIIGMTDIFRARTRVRDFWLRLRAAIQDMDEE